MAALEHVVVGGDGQARLDGAQRLGLVLAEVAVQHVRVGHLEVVAAELALVLLVHVAVGDDVLLAALLPARPDEVVDAVHALQVHRQALQAVGELDGDGVEVEAAQLLEVGELRGLHAVDPDLPALAPGAERGALPVVLDEAHVVLGEDDAEGLERAQVDVLDVRRRRLDDHLVLVVVAQAVGVLAVAAVGGAHGRLDVGGAPGTGVEAAQERRRVEGAGADLGVVRLHDDAALPLPEGLQAADDLLERRGRGGCGLGVVGHVSFRVGSAILAGSRRSEQTGAVRATDGCSIRGVPRSGYSRSLAGPAANAGAGQGRATATRTPAGGVTATRAPARQGCAGRTAQLRSARPREASRACPRPRPSRSFPLSPRRRCAARAGGSRCGTRTAGARLAAPRRSRPTTAARAARPAAATATRRAPRWPRA